MEISQKIGQLVVIAPRERLTRRAVDDIYGDRTPAPFFLIEKPERFDLSLSLSMWLMLVSAGVRRARLRAGSAMSTRPWLTPASASRTRWAEWDDGGSS